MTHLSSALGVSEATLFTGVRGIGILRSSDAGSCIEPPLRAARMASGGCHAACEESTVMVLHEDAGSQIGPYRIAAGPGFLCRQAAPPRCVLHKTPRETGAAAPPKGAQAVG